MRAVLVAAAVACFANASAVASPVASPVLHPGQQLHIAGTRVYCGVKDGATGVLTTCLVVKTGTQSPEGYSVGIDDKIAGVTRFVGNTAPSVFIRAQPTGSAAQAAATASGMVTIKVGDKVTVAGSHVVLYVSTYEGAPFLAGWVAGSDQQPLDHSYMIGISDRAVNVQQWHAGKASVVYVKNEPGS